MHTKEPWRIGQYVPQVVCAVHEGEDVIVVEPFGMNDASDLRLPLIVQHANARRIVACVNALEHVSTEQLETGELLSLSQQAVDLRRQRDGLLEAMAMIMHATAPTHNDGAYHENAYSLAEAAIAKAGGDV